MPQVAVARHAGQICDHSGVATNHAWATTLAKSAGPGACGACPGCCPVAVMVFWHTEYTWAATSASDLPPVMMVVTGAASVLHCVQPWHLSPGAKGAANNPHDT